MALIPHKWTEFVTRDSRAILFSDVHRAMCQTFPYGIYQDRTIR